MTRILGRAVLSALFRLKLKIAPKNKGFHDSAKALVSSAADSANGDENMADEKILTVPLSKMAAELSEKHEMSKKLAGELLAGSALSDGRSGRGCGGGRHGDARHDGRTR